MNKIKFIKTSLWSDEVFHNMMPHDKLITLYLLIGPNTSMCGIWEISLSDLAHYTGYRNGPIENGWTNYLNLYSSIAAYDTNTREVAILDWPRLNLLNANKRALAAAKRDLLLVKSQALLKAIIQANSSTLSQMYTEQLRRNQMERINKAKELSKIEDSDIAPKNGEQLIPFDNQQVASKVKLNTNTVSNRLFSTEKQPPQKATKKTRKTAFVKPHKNEIYLYLLDLLKKHDCKNPKGWAEWNTVEIYDFYEERDWKVKSRKMSSWRSAVTRWFKENLKKSAYSRRCPSDPLFESDPFYRKENQQTAGVKYDADIEALKQES